jgi:hypothetical protein
MAVEGASTIAGWANTVIWQVWEVIVIVELVERIISERGLPPAAASPR